MKKIKITESQIIKAIKEAENGRPIPEVSRELSINPQTFYKWEGKLAGMDSEHLRRLKVLEKENRKLKHKNAN